MINDTDVTQKDYIAEAAARFGTSVDEEKERLAFFCEFVNREVSRGFTFRIYGFGRFYYHLLPERIIRDYRSKLLKVARPKGLIRFKHK